MHFPFTTLYIKESLKLLHHELFDYNQVDLDLDEEDESTHFLDACSGDFLLSISASTMIQLGCPLGSIFKPLTNVVLHY